MVQSASATFFPWPSRSILRSPGERRKGRGRKCSPPPMHCFLLDPQYANGIAGSFPLGIILGKCRHSRRFTGFFFLGYLEALAAHVAFTLSSRGLSLPLPFPPPATWGLEEEVASVSFPPRYSLLPHRFITSNAANASARGTAVPETRRRKNFFRSMLYFFFSFHPAGTTRSRTCTGRTWRHTGDRRRGAEEGEEPRQSSPTATAPRRGGKSTGTGRGTTTRGPSGTSKFVLSHVCELRRN